MLTEYIQAAMRKAKYEILEGNEGFYGEIPGFQGVYSNAKTLAECRNILQEILEGWILLNISDNTPLPTLAGINLQFSKSGTRTIVSSSVRSAKIQKVILGVFIVATFFFATDKIYAQCDCIKNYVSAYDEFKGSDIVFVGEVIEIRKIRAFENSEYSEFEVKFKVVTSWKTDLNEIITLRNTASGSSEFEKSKSYLVYARTLNNALRANFGCCTKTKPLSKASKDLQEFEDNGEKQTNIVKTSH